MKKLQCFWPCTLAVLSLLLADQSSGQIIEAIPQQTRPAWSPDGQFYAYLSNATGQYQLYTKELQSNVVQQITAAELDVLQFEWSPTGTRLVYLSAGALTVINADGTMPARLVTELAEPTFFAWTPDGRGITYSCAIRGKAADICQKNLHDHFDINLTGHPALDGNFSWSPDGRQIAFGSDRTGQLAIHLLDLRTDTSLCLTALPFSAIDPVFSPDGKYLSFVAGRKGQNREFDVYVLNLSNRQLHQLSDGPGYHFPLWYPDSRQLIINSTRNGNSEFYRINLDGSRRDRLGNGIAFSIHPDGDRVLVQVIENGLQTVRILPIP